MYVYALHCARSLGVVASLLLLVACSNGRGSVDAEPPPGEQQEAFTVGGTISGLAGSGLVLQLNGGSDLAPVTNGNFTFSSTLADTAAYTVTVLSQPTTPAQTCTVGNATGSIAAANVTNVAVTCTTGAFAIRGTVSGLIGSGLVLQNNGTDDLPINADGSFGFATAVLAGRNYSVTVLTQPSNPSQSCTVANTSGTVGSADVTDIAVTCVTGTFTVGGTVSGLIGSGLVLQNNGGDNLTITGNGSFTFVAPLASGANYDVMVLTHPVGPTQSCTVTNGSGTIAGGNVTNVAVGCATNQFTIGGTVTGYTGTGLVLQLNNGNDLSVNNTSPSFAFTRALPSGADYFVSVRTQPSNPTQECTPSNASGRVAEANVTNIVINCVTRSFAIGGNVSGLSGAGLVLQLNGAADLSIASNGEFTFAGEHLSGTTYTVSVRTDPTNPPQTCTIENPTGTVGGADVRDVRVRCATSTFTIGGSVSGLLGGRLVLQNNGGNNLDVTADGPFTFTQPLASGADYAVTVQTQPSNPAQTCSVSNGSGQVSTTDVTNVVVTCNADFTIGGSVSGLAGSGLQLLNNGGDALPIPTNGTFTFQTALPAGATYNVSIGAQPAGPTQECAVTNGQGTVGTANVTSVQVACTTIPTEFMVRVSVSGLTGSGLVLQNNGGTAVDAAIAVGYALAVTYPAAGNLGGGGFMTLQLADGRKTFLDFREKAPLAATADMYLDRRGNVVPDLSTRGHLAVGVPGTVSGLEYARVKYGTMPREALIAPAIQLAEKGFVLAAGDVEMLTYGTEGFRKDPASAAIFLDDGRPFRAGQRLAQKDLARTLRSISQRGTDGFYKGPVAAALVAASKAGKGIITQADLDRYSTRELAPVECDYRDFHVVTAPPPSGGGIALCEMLNILEGYPLKSMGRGSAQSLHYQIEAMRHAYADRNTYLGDPDFVKNPVQRLISDAYAARIRKLIDPQRAGSSLAIRQGIEVREGSNTTHYSIADGLGNAVALTYTLNDWFGAHVTAGGTGVLLNNEMDDFTVKLGTPNLYGLVQGGPNVIEPGKRPLSSMTPTIITREGKPLLILGTPGGSRITTAVLLTILNVLDFGLDIQQAVDAPRFHQQWLPEATAVEDGAFSAHTRKALERMGHQLGSRQPSNHVAAILIGAPALGAAPIGKSRYYGGLDRRRNTGLAKGY